MPPAVPLQPGQPLAYWRHSDVIETRYDLPDTPMRGAIDAAFFRTRHRNFVPHEYPCRTEFAAIYRGRRPEVRGAQACRRNWLPVGSPRLDLSGFWFRPTRLAAWARTRLHCAAAGEAAFRLSTCGGAVLFVNGREAGHLSPYFRNREDSALIAVLLEPGNNEIAVFFDDLAERDTRFCFGLDWLSGPEARQVLPFATPGAAVRDVEGVLSALHFDRASYAGGALHVTLQQPPGRPARLAATLGDDTFAADLVPGQTDAVLCSAEDLPPGFHHVRVELEAAGFTAARTLGVEITRTSLEPPPDLPSRIAEALETVAARGLPGNVTALARLATGRSGVKTEMMIADALSPIEDCWDCADFALVPLIWARNRFAGVLSQEICARIDRALLDYRYWLDEPGNDVQWYFSENHALLLHSAAYLSGHLLPTARFRRSGRSGTAQSDAGRERLLTWFEHFERWEMAEFNSAAYFPIDLKGLAALFALAPDADIRDRAERGIARLLEIVANSAHHGMLTAAQGRAYEHSLCPAASLELSAVARLLWGRGGDAGPIHALPLLALCLRDHGLTLPADLTGRANWTGPGAHEWCFAQGENRFAKLYHYKNRAYALGSAASYRWFEWGYQETLIHARIGSEPQAQVWINHPGEAIQFGFARPSYWGGNASIPRVQQYRALAIVIFEGRDPQPDFTHAWFPRCAFDETNLEDRTAFARSGEGLLALTADAALEPITAGPSAGCELRLAGRRGRWILRLGDSRAHGALGAFRARFARLALREAERGRFVVDDPDYGAVCFEEDGTVTAEGRRLDPAGWTIAGHRSTAGPVHAPVDIREKKK